MLIKSNSVQTNIINRVSLDTQAIASSTNHRLKVNKKADDIFDKRENFDLIRLNVIRINDMAIGTK